MHTFTHDQLLPIDTTADLVAHLTDAHHTFQRATSDLSHANPNHAAKIRAAIAAYTDTMNRISFTVHTDIYIAIQTEDSDLIDHRHELQNVLREFYNWTDLKTIYRAQSLPKPTEWSSQLLEDFEATCRSILTAWAHRSGHPAAHAIENAPWEVTVYVVKLPQARELTP